MTLCLVCRHAHEAVCTHVSAVAMIRPFRALANRSIKWTIQQATPQGLVPAPKWDIHTNGEMCEFSHLGTGAISVVVQGWILIKWREVDSGRRLVVVFRRKIHGRPPGFMVTTLSHKGIHSSVIIDSDTHLPCCITHTGTFVVAKIGKNVASTGKTRLAFYENGHVEPRVVSAIGIMEGSIKAVCEVGGVVMCLARLNHKHAGRLALMSFNKDGERHRCWYPDIDNLVGIETDHRGPGFVLIDSGGGKWGP